MKNLVKQVVYTFMVLLIAPPMLKAQEEPGPLRLELSLDEAIEYALIHNVNVRNSELDIESAKKEVWKTTAIGLPQVEGGANYQHIPGEIPTINFAPPGMEDEGQEIQLGVKNSTTYNVTVSQLVFSGEYIVGLQASRTFLQLSKNSLESSELDTKESVINSYQSVLAIERNLAILDSSLSNLDITLEETKAMVDAGFMEDTDYEQLLITRNSLSNNLNSVRRQVEISYLLMKLNLGLTSGDEIVLTESLDDIMTEIELEKVAQQEFVVENNINYRILETQEQISELNLKREQSKFLPSLSAFYTYQNRTNRPDFDILFEHLIGLNLSVPIFSSGQRLASVQQARIELEKTQNSLNQLSLSLTLAVEQALSDFNTAYENYQVEKENIALAEKIYERTLVKFKEGVASSLDVTQANTQYLDSNAAFTQATLSLLSTKTALDKALNNL